MSRRKPLPKMSPSALARAIALLRARGKHKEADILVAHLPPAHDPVPHLDANGGPDLIPSLPAIDTDPKTPPDDGMPMAKPPGGLPQHGVPHPDNPHSEGSAPPRFHKSFDPTSPLDALTYAPLSVESHSPVPSFPNETLAPRKYGCVMLRLPANAIDRVLSLGRMIPDRDLAEDGREESPHVTALHGLHQSDPLPVYRVLEHFRPVRMHLGDVSVFPGTEYDVLKIDVESDSLHRLNAALRSLPHTSTYPEYHPHATIAYVRPGLGAVYAARFGSVDLTCVSDVAIFSDATKTKHMIPLGRSVRIEKAFDPKEPRDKSGEWTASDSDKSGRSRAVALARRMRNAVTRVCGGTDGQCATVVAALKDAVPGAEIYRGQYHGKHGNGPHYIAKVGNWFIDVTADQFGGAPVRVFHESQIPSQYKRANGFTKVKNIDGSFDEESFTNRAKIARSIKKIASRLPIEKAMSYLNASAGGALVAPAGVSSSPRHRVKKLKRNKLALRRVLKDTLASLSGGYEPVTLPELSFPNENLNPEFDAEEFVFGVKSLDTPAPQSRHPDGRYANWRRAAPRKKPPAVVHPPHVLALLEGAAWCPELETKAFDESHIAREKEAHDGKRPGEFAPKDAPSGSTDTDKPKLSPRARAVADAAKHIPVTDELVTAEKLEPSGSSGWDEVEERMTPREREDMESTLAEWKDNWVSDKLSDFEPDIDDDEIAKEAGWSDKDIAARAKSLIDDLDEDNRENIRDAAEAAIKDWYNSTRRHGVKAIDELADELAQDDDYSELADKIRELSSDAEDDIEKEKDKQTESATDDERSHLEDRYDDSDDKIQYLREFFDKHGDESRFAGEVKHDTWGVDSDGDLAYVFDTPNGDYTITVFDRSHAGQTVKELVFSDASGSFEITKAGNPHEVFGKVVPAVTALVAKKDIPALSFTAAEPSRQRLYDRLVRTIAASDPRYAAVAVSPPDNPKRYLVVLRDKLPALQTALETLAAGRAQVETLVKSYDNSDDKRIVILPPATDDEISLWHTPHGWNEPKPEAKPKHEKALPVPTHTEGQKFEGKGGQWFVIRQGRAIPTANPNAPAEPAPDQKKPAEPEPSVATSPAPAPAQLSSPNETPALAKKPRPDPGDWTVPDWEAVPGSRGSKKRWRNRFTGLVRYQEKMPTGRSEKQRKKDAELRAQRISKPAHLNQNTISDAEKAKNELLIEPEHLVGLAGNLPGTVVTIGMPNQAYGRSVMILPSHPDVTDWSRTLNCYNDGTIKLSNNTFFLAPAAQGGGFGTEAFSNQVATCVAAGVDAITTCAGRGSYAGVAMNGYSTWPVLGYDAPLSSSQIKRLPPELKHCKTIQDLYETKEGKDWWAKHGQSTSMTFTVAPNSRSMRVLNAYLAKRGKPPIEYTAEQHAANQQKKVARADKAKAHSASKAATQQSLPIDSVHIQWARRMNESGFDVSGIRRRVEAETAGVGSHSSFEHCNATDAAYTRELNRAGRYRLVNAIQDAPEHELQPYIDSAREIGHTREELLNRARTIGIKDGQTLFAPNRERAWKRAVGMALDDLEVGRQRRLLASIRDQSNRDIRDFHQSRVFAHGIDPSQFLNNISTVGLHHVPALAESNSRNAAELAFRHTADRVIARHKERSNEKQEE